MSAWGVPGISHAAEITDLVSSFEKDKPFGFRLTAGYSFLYKTASITRESTPQLQSPAAATALNQHFDVPAGQTLSRTETVPDLLYTQKRQTFNLRADIGVFQDLQLGIELPMVIQDIREYDLDPNAGFNRCNPGSWGCIASLSSTYLDGIYPIQPADQRSSLVFSPPYRGASGGGGANMLDTLNLSLTWAPISQRHDATKPTWIIGFEAQVRVGTVMQYNVTTLRQPSTSPLYSAAEMATGGNGQQGWNGVSEGLHRFIFRTALSHRFRYVDPYLGLWYMLPVPDQGAQGSPWQDLGFQQKYSSPQNKAGASFGFEAIPLENKAKGHKLVLDFRGGIIFNFLGRGYSEAWELLAASNALVCDDQTALPPQFNVAGSAKVTQGTFNPACRTPGSAGSLNTASPYYQQAYSGVTLIENYLQFSAQIGVTADLYRHFRLRLGFEYQRTQGHIITDDDAGTTTYTNRPGTCMAGVVDLNCPSDWNPAYRAAINEPGRRYRVDDVAQYNGNATLQYYW